MDQYAHMINQRSLQVVGQAQLPHGFLKPRYESYCFSQIPNTVLTLLGCGSAGEMGLPKDCIQNAPTERVVLLLIDGFGWKFFEKYKDKYPFLKKLSQEGIVSKLTSQFPSTTAAHITTLCSNQPVGQHGIYEWFIYEPSLERVIAPLLYSFAGDKKIGSLDGILNPLEFFPENLFFKKLQNHNINTTILQQDTIANSIYSKTMFNGANRVAYKDWKDAIRLLKSHLQKPGFFYLYFGDFDSESHHHGVTSLEVEKALDRCFHELETIIFPSSTTVIITADHGMIDIDPKTTIYLNQKFPTLESKLKKGADGHVLSPAGSCRDYFLHVKPSHIMDVLNELKEGLQEAAWVCLTAELIEKGFFGPQGISHACQKRMGEIAIIAKGSHSIWWYEKGRFEQNLHAMHGGLTPDELEVPFLCLNTNL
ncbi:MAG: alkaline phosphatase family protein [Rhabdochlamydiaceae bacterium]|nr:alkaline phosphatase family protein [Rhabdochlamydiaceae bacterium]